MQTNTGLREENANTFLPIIGGSLFGFLLVSIVLCSILAIRFYTIKKETRSTQIREGHEPNNPPVQNYDTFCDIQPSTPKNTTDEDSVSPSLMQEGHTLFSSDVARSQNSIYNVCEEEMLPPNSNQASTVSLSLGHTQSSCDNVPGSSNVIYDVCKDIHPPYSNHVNISEDDSTDSLFLDPVLPDSCDDLATSRNSNIYDVCEDIVSPTTYLEDSSGYFKPQDLSREVSLSSFGNGGDDLPHKGIDDNNIYDADGYVQSTIVTSVPPKITSSDQTQAPELTFKTYSDESYYEVIDIKGEAMSSIKSYSSAICDEDEYEYIESSSPRPREKFSLNYLEGRKQIEVTDDGQVVQMSPNVSYAKRAAETSNTNVDSMYTEVTG